MRTRFSKASAAGRLALAAMLCLTAAAAWSQHAISVSESAGGALPWQGSVGSVNTGNGNKLTTVPIVGWTARGGMPVAFALFHSSQSARNSELGQKWSHSFDITGSVDGSGNFTVTWGNGTAYTFTNMITHFTTATGFHDTLTATGSPITSYDLKTTGQVIYHFTNPNSSGWVCSTITDRNSNVITVNHDASNNVTTIVDPTSRTITLTLTSGKISSIGDPLSRSWSVSYSGSDLTQVTWPTVGGNSYNEQFAYDAGGHHDIVTFTDKRGHTSWSATYNSADDSLATLTDACSNTSSFSYASGATTVTDANSHSIVHNFTSGRLTSVQDPLSNSEGYSWDSNNNRTGVSSRNGHSSSYTFDSSGNMLTKTDELSHEWVWTYTSMNDMATLVDPLGNQVVNSYSTAGNLTQVQEKDASNNVKATTSFAYDTGNHGLLVSKTDNNSHTTSYGRNTNGDLTSRTTPGSRTLSWVKDALGNVTSRTDEYNRTTTYTLDNWERCTVVDHNSGWDATFTFDANSNLTAWTDNVANWLRTYDNDNRQLTEKLNGVTKCSNTFDGTGQKGLLSSSAMNGRTVTFGYTGRNELYTVNENSGTTTYSYDNDGNETGITLPNSATVTKVYDSADRLTSVTNKNSGGTTLGSFGYVYNSDDRKASCTEANGDVVSWGYDAQGHLTSESRTGSSAYSASYTVDGTGLRTAQTIGTASTSFTFDSDDRLTGASSSTGGLNFTWTYSTDGNQSVQTYSGSNYTLAYDTELNLTEIDSSGVKVVGYQTDVFQRRVERWTSGTGTVLYNFGPDGHVWYDSGGAVYAWGNELIRKDGEYPMFDGLGSERTVTNSSQTVTGTICYDAFGQTVATTGSSADPYKWLSGSGYRDDGDFGLVSVGARVYDPEVGRFLERDSHLDQLAYTYCNGDPINRRDPSGHDDDMEGDLGALTGILALLAWITDPEPISKTLTGAAAMSGGAAAIVHIAKRLHTDGPHPDQSRGPQGTRNCP